MIEKHSGSNFGKILSIAFLPVNEVDSRVKNLSTFTDSITPSSGSSFEDIYFVPGSLTIDASDDETDAGDRYAYQINFEVPRDRESVEQTLATLKRRNFILKLIDAQGTTRTIDCQKVRSKMLKSSQAEQLNGYQITFNAEMTHPALYM